MKHYLLILTFLVTGLTCGSVSAADGDMNLTLPGLLEKLNSTSGYFFTLEELNTVSLEGGVEGVKARAKQNGNPFVRLSEIELHVNGKQEVADLIVRCFPRYRVVEAQHTILPTLHVIDRRLDGIDNYPLDTRVDTLAFTGTPDGLLDEFHKIFGNIKRRTTFFTSDLFSCSDDFTKLDVKLSDVTLREVIATAVYDKSYRAVIWY